MRQKQIDFYKIYNKKPGMTARTRRLLLLFVPVALLLAVFAAILGVNVARYARLGREIEAERAYLTDSAVLADYEEYQSLSDELDMQRFIRQQFLDAQAAAGSYPKVDAALVETLLGAADGVTVTGYAYNDAGRLLTIGGTCARVGNAAQYAKALDATGRFDAVGYYGYASQNGRSYTFTVQCVLPQEVTE